MHELKSIAKLECTLILIPIPPGIEDLVLHLNCKHATNNVSM